MKQEIQQQFIQLILYLILQQQQQLYIPLRFQRQEVLIQRLKHLKILLKQGTLQQRIQQQRRIIQVQLH